MTEKELCEIRNLTPTTDKLKFRIVAGDCSGHHVAYGLCGLVNNDDEIVCIPSEYNRHSVLRIGRVLANHSNLRIVFISDGIHKLENNAFENCTSLKVVRIPKSITLIPQGVFLHCDNLKYILYGGTKAEWEKVRIITEKHELSSEHIGGVFSEKTVSLPGNEAILRATVFYNS